MRKFARKLHIKKEIKMDKFGEMVVHILLTPQNIIGAIVTLGIWGAACWVGRAIQLMYEIQPEDD